MDTSGISPITVVALIGGFLAAFAFLCLIGLLLRYTNRPSTSGGIGVGYSGGLYQPSASGYKSARAAAIAAADGSAPLQGGPRPGFMNGNESNMNLLDGASPMGYGGNDYPPTSVPGPGGRIPGTHGRAPSSGLGFPGPPAAARRGFGGQQSHPNQSGGPSSSSSSAGPDGGGFRPGQVVGGGGGGGYSGRPNGPGGLGAPPSAGPGAVQANHLRYPRGPPPASDATRRSRYSRAGGPGVNQADRRSRIDSVGPGTYRKSMYLPPDGTSPPSLPTTYNSNATQGYPPSARNGSGNSNVSNGLRRVESIGKGSMARGNSINRGGNGAMNNAPVDQKMLLGARNDNFGGGNGNGGGRRSPNSQPQQQQQNRGFQQQSQPQMNGQRRPSAGNGASSPDPLGVRNGNNQQQQQRPMMNNNNSSRPPHQQVPMGMGMGNNRPQMGSRGPSNQGFSGGMAPGQIFRPPQGGQQRALLG